MGDVTQFLGTADRGGPQAAAELLPLVYDELRKLAAARMANERPGQTLQPTALVHDAWIRLLGPEGSQKSWNSPGHFFAAAAEAMRRILIERARRRQMKERNGPQASQPDAGEWFITAHPDSEILALNEALDRLAADDPRPQTS